MKHIVLYSILGGLLVLGGCAKRITSADLSGSQELDLVVSIDMGALSKAPISGVDFGDGDYEFGLALTKADQLTDYETGTNNILATALITTGLQTWSYQWGALPISMALPRLYGGDPMQLAGYYPHNVAAAADAGRDGGRINVPFDLTTAEQQNEQTDLMYSVAQSINYISGARQSVSLPFMHVYALLEFQVKLKKAGQSAKITKVEVCNKAGKDFLKNAGWFSPYTGELTASTAGNVSFVTATDVASETNFATIRVMVPPTLLAGYVDGDIYVQIYDDGVADPKEFPILKEYLIGSSTYGFTASGRYVYKLVYDNTASGSLTVDGWFTSVASGDEVGGGASSGILSLKNWGASLSADATLGSGPPFVLPEFIEVNGLKWATGNLVATGENSCKIGKPADGGVYFHFGSLVGWSGGTTGDGMGTVGSPALAIQVKPADYAGSISWPAGHYTTADESTGGYDLPRTDNSATGVGDPCRYYLGSPWRLPTTTEFAAIVGAEHYDYIYWTDERITGRWVAAADKFDDISGPGAWLGPGLSKGTGTPDHLTNIFLPYSGMRSMYGVMLAGVGALCSSSVDNYSNIGYARAFLFNESTVSPQRSQTVLSGFPVRCVSGELPPLPTTPNTPTADQIVKVDGLSWTKGNLIAVNASNCKVGAATDHGLYFQFGSLVGWKGGSNGDGVGTTTGSLATEVHVKPTGYSGTTEWTTAGRYKDGTTKTEGYDLPADAPTTGIGDPCRYYLGAPWRTPTAVEWLALLGVYGANTDISVPLTINNTALSFPASGYYEDRSAGELANIGSKGLYWSSSVSGLKSGYNLDFGSDYVTPHNLYERPNGLSVRCVSGELFPLMVYGKAPFPAEGDGLAGSTESSYNSWIGTVADGNNGAYQEYMPSDVFDNERPFHRLEVALEDENGGAACTWDAARKFCVDKTTDGGGWRLPRVSELWWIYLNHAALVTAVPSFSAIGSLNLTWSATEYNASNAWYVAVGGTGDNSSISKSSANMCGVRCVRER